MITFNRFELLLGHRFNAMSALEAQEYSWKVTTPFCFLRIYPFSICSYTGYHILCLSLLVSNISVNFSNISLYH